MRQGVYVDWLKNRVLWISVCSQGCSFHGRCLKSFNGSHPILIVSTHVAIKAYKWLIWKRLKQKHNVSNIKVQLAIRFGWAIGYTYRLSNSRVEIGNDCRTQTRCPRGKVTFGADKMARIPVKLFLQKNILVSLIGSEFGMPAFSRNCSYLGYFTREHKLAVWCSAKKLNCPNLGECFS